MTTAAVIVAAGRGERLGGGLPKQFREVGGVPLVVRAAWAFDRSPAMDRLLVALPQEHLDYAAREIFGPLEWRLRPQLLAGGAERSDSVRRCLEALDDAVEYVLIHDGARPLVSSALVSRLAAEVKLSGAVVAAVREKNTLKRVSREGLVIETVDRREIWEAQTPQAFKLSLLREAHARAGLPTVQEPRRGEDAPRLLGGPSAADATDDAVLVERLGHAVRIIEGDYANLKVTTELDLELANCLVSMLTPGGSGIQERSTVASLLALQGEGQPAAPRGGSGRR